MIAALVIVLAAPQIQVGSKKFTESVVLGELAAHVARQSGAEATHRRELGGTRVVWSALLAGDIDVYAEYTGTLQQEILKDGRTLAEHNVVASKPLGFNNTYALAVTRATAKRLTLRRVSDLRAHADARLRFGNEFMDRGDGWPSLRGAYGLTHSDVRGLDHDLAYRGLVAGDFDVMDAYSTDAEVAYYDLVVLEDDRRHFPRYDAVWVWRADLQTRAPQVVAALQGLAGRISEADMAGMNKRAKIDKVAETQVAADFLAKAVGAKVDVQIESRASRIWRHTKEHLAAALALVVQWLFEAVERLREWPR